MLVTGMGVSHSTLVMKFQPWRCSFISVTYTTAGTTLATTTPESCGGQIIENEFNSPKLLRSPGYPEKNYSNNVFCLWNIATGQVGARVSIKFNFIDVCKKHL